MSQNNLDEPTDISNYNRNSVRKENYANEDENQRVDSTAVFSSDNLKFSANSHENLLETNIESQSEWSEDDCRDEAGGCESAGYITDEPGLENLSLLNEAGLTDAEGALSDVNSLYNAPDDTSISSSRASSRLELSLDSLSGLYDCEIDSKSDMASKFGPRN